MRNRIACICIIAIPLLQACSHIPDPGEIEGAEPYAIIHSVRCELRGVLESGYRDEAVLQKAKIGYGLKLKAEQISKNTLGPNIKWPVLQGFIALGASAGSESERYTEGITNLTEPLAKVEAAQCGAEEQPHIGLYPIVGTLGLEKVVRRFVEVNKIGLTAAKEGFVQELKFRLKFSGGLKPSYELTTLINPTTTGIFDFSTDRQDTHTLTITMAPYREPEKPEAISVSIVNLDQLEKRVPEKGKKKSGRSPATFTVKPSFRTPSNDTDKALEDTLRSRQNQERFENFIEEKIR